MKKTKYLVSIVIVLSLMMSLVACGEKEPEKVEDHEAVISQITRDATDNGVVYTAFIKESFDWDNASLEDRKALAQYIVEQCEYKAKKDDLQLDMIVGQTDDLIMSFTYQDETLTIFKDNQPEE